MARPGYQSVVLITGFPSFLAQKLALFLLHNEPGTLIVALVLPKLVVEARRVIDSLDLADRERVVLLEGDAAAIDLGLSGAELRQLARDVDRIHHAAHAGFLGVDKPTAHALNVVGAGEIVEVARLMNNLQHLVFHSTAFVAGSASGTVFEEDLSERTTYRTVIEQTRADGERVIARAQKNLPISIVRPTMIVGDSTTGEIDRLDLPYLFVLLLLAAPADLALPIGSFGDAPLHVVPIDFVVRASVAIGKEPRAIGRTFHLRDPQPMPIRQFVTRVHQIRAQRSAWVELSTLARSMFRTPGIEGYLRSPKSLVEQLLTSVHFDARNADAVLDPLGIVCPSLPTYVERMVTAVEERLVGRSNVAGNKPLSDAFAREEPSTDAASHDTDAMD